MNVSEFSPLTREALHELLGAQPKGSINLADKTRRRASRWPFPATVELWVPDECTLERHHLATCLNISAEGIGVRSDEPIECGVELSMAVHQPEMTLYGRCTVRHCTHREGAWYIGLEFKLEDDWL
jgi:hypothetical protein